MSNNSIFVPLLIPHSNVNVEGILKTRFSVCIELNSDHPVFSPGGNPVEWRTKVAMYHDKIIELKNNLKILIEANPDPAFTIIEEYPDDPYGIARRTILGNILKYETDSVGNTVQLSLPVKVAGGKNMAVHIAPFFTPAMTVSLLNNVKIPGDYNLGSTEMQLDPLAATISRVEVESEMARIRRVREGIAKACEAHKIRVGQRNEAIRRHPQNAPYYNDLMQRFIGVGSTNILSAKAEHNFSDIEAERMQNLTAVYADMQSLYSVVGNEPEYIMKAFEHINNTISLRKFLQTILTIEIKNSDLPASPFNIGLGLKTQNIDLSTYFDFSLTTACQRLNEIDDSIIIPRMGDNDAIHDTGLLKIADNCEFKSFEPEAVLQNAVNSLENYKSLMPSEQVFTVSFSNYNKQKTGIALTKSIVSAKMREIEEYRMQAMMASNKVLQMARQINNQVKDVETKGLTVYIKDQIGTATSSDTGPLYLHDLMSGYAVFGRPLDKPGAKWTSLTEINEQLVFNAVGLTTKPSEIAEMGVNINLGMQSTTDGDGVTNGQLNDLKSTFLFFWDGTKVGSMNPMQQYENEKKSAIDQAEAFKESVDDVQVEILALEQKMKKIFAIDWFPFRRRKEGENPDLLLKRGFVPKVNTKLRLGSSYEFVLAAQLQNGAVFLKELITADNVNSVFNAKLENCKTKAQNPQFLRHQHIKGCIISLKNNIYKDETTGHLLPQYAGESHNDLAVRTGELLDNGEASRFILPPPVPSFQLYLWYKREGKLGDRQLQENPSAEWFLRYQCELENEAQFKKNKEDCINGGDCRGCRAGCQSYCKGNKQPRIFKGVLNYIPDPIVRGFVIKIYADPEYRLELTQQNDQAMYPELYCEFEGQYPQWQPWELVIKKDPNENSIAPKIKANKSTRKITIVLKQGLQLYAKVIPAFMESTSNFVTPMINQSYHRGVIEDPDLVYNTLLTNETKLTLTHASQKPVSKPSILRESIVITRYSKEADVSGMEETSVKEESFKLDADVQFEHLNLHNNVPVPGISPTGELEIYALWDDYSDRMLAPHKSINDKINRSLNSNGFLRLATIKFGELKTLTSTLKFLGKEEEDPFKMSSSKQHFTCEPDILVPHRSDIVFKVRNTSKFSGYFGVDLQQSPEEKEFFSRWSDELKVASDGQKSVQSFEDYAKGSFLFNNKKIPAPRIAKIVPVKVTDMYDKKILEHSKFTRFYFEPSGMNFGGKAQRIAIILGKGNSQPYAYKAYYGSNNFISKVGTDIVTVNPNYILKQAELLGANIYMDENDTVYMKKFFPRYEAQGLPVEQETLELMTYIPVFDSEQDLWYVDIGLSIRTDQGKEVHTIFAQLNFIYYQEFSSNYNRIGDTKVGYEKDYRLSQPVQADFISVFPTRTYNNHWVLLRRNQNEYFSFTPEPSSLYFKGTTLLTQFFVIVQKQQDAFWRTIESTYKDSSGQVAGKKFHPILPLNLSPAGSGVEYKFNLDWQGRGSFRVLIMEIDYFNEGNDLTTLIKYLASSNAVDHELTDIPGVWLRNTLVISESPE